MSDPQHRSVVRLAEHGEAPGIARFANQPDDDYMKAAELAVEHTGFAVIVREWPLAGPAARVEGGHTDPSDARRINETNENVARHVAAERQAQARLLTRLDQTTTALAPWPVDADRTIERFQVSQTTVAIDDTYGFGKKKTVVRTVIVFHPDGRPRTRRTRSTGAPADEPVEQPDNDDGVEPDQHDPADPPPVDVDVAPEAGA